MTITEVYEKYQTPPNLQLHQLRVAAVAKLIAENIPDIDDPRDIITASLLHDMGNLVKFKMDKDEPWMESDGLAVWQEKQRDFIQKYGQDDHLATIAILNELGISPTIIGLIQDLPENSLHVDNEMPLALMICIHADQRVNPDEIVSIEGRMDYLAARYEKYADPAKKADFIAKRRRLQAKIQTHVKIDLDSVTNESAQETIESLRTYEL